MYELRDDVPVPEDKNLERLRFVLSEIKPEQSFWVDDWFWVEATESIINALSFKPKFYVRVRPEGTGYRIWRVA